ncbi:hypothetical protein M440DRAFT_142334 [Trichoderma longibrachiatum ATCC 18648]|uniref:Uncharacterized protein n=1 Tax=Trichoderma longibrachiatum ATCC 18648 TaxID=983965 RepID=A0A2T4BV56_TRILO|nr:hypothetical protein M440DRAFT_142334 [Trichoderma longibrachiatum ATCC 18648]
MCRSQAIRATYLRLRRIPSLDTASFLLLGEAYQACTSRGPVHRRRLCHHAGLRRIRCRRLGEQKKIRSLHHASGPQ